MTALPLLVAGAAAGASADLLAAKIAGRRAKAHTSVAVALIAVLLTRAMLIHAPHTWHGRLMPLWAWGWLLVADIDLRTRLVYDLHVAALTLIALAAGALDHQLIVSVTSALLVAGLLAALNVAAASDQRHAWPVVVAAGAGLVFAGAAWALTMRLTAALPVRGLIDPRVLLATLIAVAPPTLIVLVRRMARGWDGELVGWGDVLLVGLMGLWFGLRWVWAPLLVAIAAAAGLGVIRWIAVVRTAKRAPWLREAQPTVPGLFVGAVLGLALGGL